MHHWVYNTNLFGNNVSFNLDTIFTMWFAMLVVILFAFIATRHLAIIPNKLQAIAESILKFFWGILNTMMLCIKVVITPILSIVYSPFLSRTTRKRIKKSAAKTRNKIAPCNILAKLESTLAKVAAATVEPN